MLSTENIGLQDCSGFLQIESDIWQEDSWRTILRRKLDMGSYPCRGTSQKLHKPWSGLFKEVVGCTYQIQNLKNRRSHIVVNFSTGWLNLEV